MLYYFLVPLAKDHIVFNVFRYLTFRSFMALISAFIISLVVGPWIIRRLRIAQHGGETIREDTPERHRTKKGTPTMGGIVILTAIIATTLLWANLGNRYVWVVILATGGFGLIGIWDDVTKLRRRKGISTRVKFFAQVAVSFAVLQLIFWQPPSAWLPVLAIPFFKGWLVDLGWLWIPFAILVIIGASNAVNLTDGLDGLAIGPIIMAGGAFGFLWFNCHPAQVFMGDVGSLALGGAIGTLAVLTKAELLLPLIGGLYVVEAASVIIQVGYFKLTGKRFFRMAPLHHHYEMQGWPEPKIIVRFWIVSFMLALLALTTLKLR